MSYKEGYVPIRHSTRLSLENTTKHTLQQNFNAWYHILSLVTERPELSQLGGLRLTLLGLRRSQGAVLLGLLNLLQDSSLERLGLGGAGPAADDLSVGGDEELLKVPLDALQAQQTGLRLLQPGEDGGRVLTVHVQLAQHGERDAVVQLAELLDLVVGAGVLAAELVAGEAEDGEVVRVLLLDGLVQALEALELRREAALGGGVDDEDDLALEGVEGEGGALL